MAGPSRKTIRMGFRGTQPIFISCLIRYSCSFQFCSSEGSASRSNNLTAKVAHILAWFKRHQAKEEKLNWLLTSTP